MGQSHPVPKSVTENEVEVEEPTLVGDPRKATWVSNRPEEKERRTVIKLVTIGVEDTGKTILIRRIAGVPVVRTTHYINTNGETIVQREWMSESTIGASFYTTFGSVVLDHQRVPLKVECWDTAGQERYRSLSPMYMRGARVVLIFYDVSRRVSFETLEHSWWPEVLRKERMDCMTYYLVGILFPVDMRWERVRFKWMTCQKVHSLKMLCAYVVANRRWKSIDTLPPELRVFCRKAGGREVSFEDGRRLAQKMQCSGFEEFEILDASQEELDRFLARVLATSMVGKGMEEYSLA